MTTYTADQLEEGIANALKAHDVQAAYDMLTVLASVDVLRAGVVLDQIQLGLTLAARGSTEGPQPEATR